MESKGKTPADRLEQALKDLEERKRSAAELMTKMEPERQKLAALWEKIEGLPQEERRRVLDAAGLKHVSAAPKPITPIRSALSTPYRPKSTAKRPDWSFWLNLSAVQVWQACALSLNIDPDSMKHSPNGWMAGPGNGPKFEPGSFPSKETEDTFSKRLRLLAASIANPAYFRLRSIIMGEASRCEIYLSEFAAWAASVVKWSDLPPELVAIGRQTGTPPITTEQWTAFIQEDAAARQDPAYKAKYDRAAQLHDELEKWERMNHQSDPFRAIKIDERLSAIRAELAELNKGSNIEVAPGTQAAPTETSKQDAGTAWPEEKLLSLLAAHNHLKASREKAPTKTLAAQYGLSEKRIREHLVRARALAETQEPTSKAAQFNPHDPFGLLAKPRRNP